MLIKNYIELCKEFQMVSWEEWGSNLNRQIYLDKREPDFGCVKDGKYTTLVGFRRKANKNKWSKGSMIVYHNGVFCGKWASTKKEAKKLLVDVLTSEKNKAIDKRLKALNKDFV